MKTKTTSYQGPLHHLANHRLSRLSRRALSRLPKFEGAALRVRFLPSLTADHKRLYSSEHRGEPVHAASFIRKRTIVLDTELRTSPTEFSRILVHEIFHFTWVRLGNPKRQSYEAMLRTEFERRARGELGWSAESRKRVLIAAPSFAFSVPKWREYVCESFCDTAAWLYSGLQSHDEFSLASSHRARRAAWFEQAFGNSGIPI